jgi:hypothetical protein
VKLKALFSKENTRLYLINSEIFIFLNVHRYIELMSHLWIIKKARRVRTVEVRTFYPNVIVLLLLQPANPLHLLVCLCLNTKFVFCALACCKVLRLLLLPVLLQLLRLRPLLMLSRLYLPD